jgi:hypothetical protein
VQVKVQGLERGAVKVQVAMAKVQACICRREPCRTTAGESSPPRAARLCSCAKVTAHARRAARLRSCAKFTAHARRAARLRSCAKFTAHARRAARLRSSLGGSFPTFGLVSGRSGCMQERSGWFRVGFGLDSKSKDSEPRTHWKRVLWGCARFSSHWAYAGALWLYAVACWLYASLRKHTTSMQLHTTRVRLHTPNGLKI